MALPRVGQQITPFELKARWAYGELISRRFSESYRTLVAPGLFDLAGSGTPFERLDMGEVKHLAAALDAHPDRHAFATALDLYERFECVLWTASDLRKVVCVPGLRWRSLLDLLEPPDLDAREVRNWIDNGDTPTKPFEQVEPVIVLLRVEQPEARGRPVLLEGTSRSLWFLSWPPASGKIYVWVEVGSSDRTTR
jgi:hypothetical protein